MQYSESDNEDFEDKDDSKHRFSRSQNQIPLEQSNMMLDMQNSQESQSTQFKYDQQSMMEIIPEEFDEYKDEQNQQYSMIPNEGKFLLFVN